MITFNNILWVCYVTRHKSKSPALGSIFWFYVYRHAWDEVRLLCDREPELSAKEIVCKVGVVRVF